MMNMRDSIVIFLLTGIMVVIGNNIGYKHPIHEAVVGYLIMVAIIVVGMVITKVFPFKLPMVFWVSVVALLSTSPLSPIAKTISYFTGKVDFLALATPILAYAGLAVGKDLEAFKKLSWRIVIVAILVFTGTFLFATIIAQVMLKIEGVI